MNCEQSGLLNLVQGEDRNFNLRLVTRESELPLDLTTASAINARFLKQDGTVLVKVLGQGTTVASATGGKVNVVLTAADTAALKKGEGQDFEVEIVLGTGPGLLTVVQFLRALNVYPRAV